MSVNINTENAIKTTLRFIEKYINNPFVQFYRFKVFLKKLNLLNEAFSSSIRLESNQEEISSKLEAINVNISERLNTNEKSKSTSRNTQDLNSIIGQYSIKHDEKQRKIPSQISEKGKIEIRNYTEDNFIDGSDIKLKLSKSKANENITIESFERELSIKLRDIKDKENFKNRFRETVSNCGKNFSEIYMEARISKEFFYKILNGNRIPSREALIRLIIAMSLIPEEANNLLSKLGYTLCSSNKRDFIITAGLDFGIKLDDISSILEKYGETPL